MGGGISRSTSPLQFAYACQPEGGAAHENRREGHYLKKGNRSLPDIYTYVGFTLIPVALYTFFYTYSLINGIIYSFTDWNGMNPSYNMVGLDNYKWLMGNRNFWKSLGTTFRYAMLLVSAVIIISLLMALALNSFKRFKTLTKSVFFIPAMISAVTIALIWDQLFYRAIPVIGQALGIAALSQSPLANPKTALLAVVFANVWQSVSMPTLIFLAGLQTIPEEMYESAKLDGATVFQQFSNITFPYLLPTITVNLVLLVKQGFTTFDYPYTLTFGGPARATEVVSIAIVNDAFQNFRFSVANAQACILFVIVACISVVQIKLSGRGEVRE